MLIECRRSLNANSPCAEIPSDWLGFHPQSTEPLQNHTLTDLVRRAPSDIPHILEENCDIRDARSFPLSPTLSTDAIREAWLGRDRHFLRLCVLTANHLLMPRITAQCWILGLFNDCLDSRWAIIHRSTDSEETRPSHLTSLAHVFVRYDGSDKNHHKNAQPRHVSRNSLSIDPIEVKTVSRVFSSSTEQLTSITSNVSFGHFPQNV